MWIIDKNNNAFCGNADFNSFTGDILFIKKDRRLGYYGMLKNGKPDDRGIVFCSEGLCCDGIYKNGKLFGNCKIFKFAFSIPIDSQISLLAFDYLFQYNEKERYDLIREYFNNADNKLIYDGLLENNIPVNKSFLDKNYYEKLASWATKSLQFKGEEINNVVEGEISISNHVRYERSPKNRKTAIAIHGYKCKACMFDFKEKYGELGSNYIEVHHLRKVSLGPANYDPAKDLITLCSNCHSMIHKINSDDPLSDLIKIVNKTDKS
jgi:hypothetical protein